jgi:protein FAM32A
MAGDEYSTAGGGGGKLKLKGSKVKDSRVDKKHKKKKQPKDDKDSVTGGAEKAKESQDDNHQIARTKTPDQLEPESEEKRVVYKTEAERRYEEQRKKKVLSLINILGIYCILMFVAAQRPSSPRRRQDAQRTSRGAESVSEHAERAPRHVSCFLLNYLSRCLLTD